MLTGVVLVAAMSMQMAGPLRETDPACAVPESVRVAMMSASYEAFDQSTDGSLSWRAIMNRGCYETASSLIASYIAANATRMKDEDLHTMYFHVGQVLAMGGEDSKSTPWFQKAAGGTDEWNTYVSATLAFVTQDRAGFDSAYAHYREIAPDSPRAGFLAGMSACFGKSYMAAMLCG